MTSMRLRAAQLSPLAALAAVTFGSAALLAGAWFFQLVLKLEPCKLCLQQRWPHYLAVAIGMGSILLLRSRPQEGWAARLGLGALALLMAGSTALAFYHVGVEQGWFMGPADCGAGAAMPSAGSMADFMRQLQTTRVISCKAVQWELFGVSMAGWNGVFSAGLAALALSALRGIGRA